MKEFIDILFDGPPSHESGRFVEVEDENGCSINAGEWIDCKDGYWRLRISPEIFNSEEDEYDDDIDSIGIGGWNNGEFYK